MFDLNDKRTLKIIMYLIFVYSIAELLFKIIPFVSSYFNNNRSPLLPDCVVGYVAFPLYFIVPVFLGISIYALHSIRQKVFNKSITIVLLIFVIFYFIFGIKIYLFIQEYNPYCSSS